MKISIDNIAFAYNGTPVLNDLSADIIKGDLLALVGPNGSGKSTLIKCINRILKPQKGAVLVNDKNIAQLSTVELAKQMAYVPQSINKKAGMNVFDMALTGRKPYINWKPTKRDLDITAGVLKTLHIDNIAMKEVDKLSGGQQQTVYIARALVQEPDILLLDEPTANLDIKHQIEVLELLHKLAHRGLTVILAIHDINMALRYSSKMIMLKKGEIFAYGGNEIITAENLEKLYDIKVQIIRDNGNTFIVPDGLSTKQKK
jgi:iron complex transport system ATP-binding protein